MISKVERAVAWIKSVFPQKFSDFWNWRSYRPSSLNAMTRAWESLTCNVLNSYRTWTSSDNCLKVLAYYPWLLLLSLRITAVLSYGERSGWKYEIARLAPPKTDCSWSLFWMFLLALVFWYLDLCCLHNKQ